MKNVKLKRLAGLLFAGCIGMLQTPLVFAAAGDLIGNTATLNYSVGGSGQTPIPSSPLGNSDPLGGAPTEFVEDRVINFTVTEVGGLTTLVTPAATLQVQEFTVTNNGNGTQDFIFAALDNATGTDDPNSVNTDTQDVVSAQVFVETAGAGFDAGADTSIFADQVPPLGTVTVYIVSEIPDVPTVSDGDIMVMSLVAHVADGSTASADDTVAANAGAAITNDSNGETSPGGTFSNSATVVAAGTASDVGDDAAVEDVVFNDPASTALDGTVVAADDPRDGRHSAVDSYTVSTADLTVTKTSTVIYDPINQDAFTAGNFPKAIPGAYVRYTITIANAAGAGASATLNTITDTLDALTDLDPHLVSDGLVLPINLDPGTTLAGQTEDGALNTSFNVTVTSGQAAPRTVNNDVFCTAAADADGCQYVGGPGGTVTIDLSAVLAAEAGYTAGELKEDETVTITFNVIVE